MELSTQADWATNFLQPIKLQEGSSFFWARRFLHELRTALTLHILRFLGSYTPHSEWFLLSAKQIQTSQYYWCCDSPFSVINIVVKLKRRPLFHIIHLITPMILVALLGLMLFYIPARSGKETVLVHVKPTEKAVWRSVIFVYNELYFETDFWNIHETKYACNFSI